MSKRFWIKLSDPLYAWLSEATADGGEIVTASRRLARELQDAYAAQQLRQGLRAWRTPLIRSWQDWLGRTFAAIENTSATPSKLDSVSSAWLMEQCFRRQLPDALPGVGALVRRVVQSRNRLCEWQVSVAEVRASARSQDERAFSRALQQYVEQLHSLSSTDNAGLPALVAAALSDKQVETPGKLTFAGFDRLNPSVQKIVAALEAENCRVVMQPTPTRLPPVDIVAYENPDGEMRAAGAWAREKLVAQPDARVAIVSPALESDAALMTRRVREGFAPGWQYGGIEFASSVNVSYGRPLADYPLISIALLLIRWATDGLTSRELSLLLRTRCLADGRAYGRHRIELALRGAPDRIWTASDFLAVFRGTDDSPDASVFFDTAVEIESLYAMQHEELGPSIWAHRVNDVLEKAGWPGNATQTSVEYQLLNRWRELLNEFARIENVAPLLDLATTGRRIALLAHDTLYQPETSPGRVQLLGVLEAAGMEFDAIWVSGLDATQWPPMSRPAPFISTKLQREYAMPDSTPGDTLEFARGVLDRLVKSCSDCVLSWARSRDDVELTASSLLDDYGEVASAHVADPGWHAGQIRGRDVVELCAPDPAPPVASDEHVRGGAYTVQRQYQEPFAAFVYGRLGVRTPEPISSGLSAGMRGNIVHNALHNLLAGNPTQAEIVDWPADERERRIGSAIDAALAGHVAHASTVIRALIVLERRRLRLLLHDFIETESMREPFTVVAVEKQIDYQQSGVQLGLRIDRIDRLVDGRLLLIDYKTGAPKRLLKQTGEPADLQLVVYASALTDDIGGLALINIDRQRIAYKGTGGEGGPWKARDPEEWLNTLTEWRALVSSAVSGIAGGDVRLNLMQPLSDSRPLSILSRTEELKRAV